MDPYAVVALIYLAYQGRREAMDPYAVGAPIYLHIKGDMGP
jgi:hypothetical protein